MGSDTPPNILLEAIISVAPELKKRADLVILAHVSYFPKEAISGITFLPITEVISMQEAPLAAVRLKKNASICVGMQLLGEKTFDAFITGGNTGAFIACAKLFLSMLKGIDRPALLTLLPTQKNPLAVLDVGANITCKAKHLVQFASMGIAYQKSRGILNPRFSLLNNGIEENKGTSEIKEAYQSLKTMKNFAGNIEGREVFLGDIDLLVTDGFTGNIFLKTVEGISSYILHLLNQMPTPVVRDLQQHLNYAEYPGAFLAGIDGIALKYHGNSSPLSLTQSIKAALQLVEHQFLDQIKSELQNSLSS